MLQPRCVLNCNSHLGETPVWDDRAGVLWWIDIYKPTLNRFDPKSGHNTEISLDQDIHAIATRRVGGIVGSFQHGIGFVDPDDGNVTMLADPIGSAPAKFNDGKCDRNGRFWTGSMSNDWVTPIGCLFRMDADLSVRTMDTGFKLSNGMGWSPNDRIMYFTDFGQSTIFAYDYEAASGAITNRRPFIVIPETEGKPDGMTVDAEGNLWVALWDGWGIAQFDSAGRRIRQISMPIQRPTSCSFGGEGLATLYVTSAWMQLNGSERAVQPLAGDLFAIETDTHGLPEPRFAG
jgi:sugar lactone lactonase YvrE